MIPVAGVAGLSVPGMPSVAVPAVSCVAVTGVTGGLVPSMSRMAVPTTPSMRAMTGIAAPVISTACVLALAAGITVPAPSVTAVVLPIAPVLLMALTVGRCASSGRAAGRTAARQLSALVGAWGRFLVRFVIGAHIPDGTHPGYFSQPVRSSRSLLGAQERGRPAVGANNRALPIGRDRTGYAAIMELLVILAIPIAVAAVIIYRKTTGKHPNEPLTPDNDGE